MSWSGGCPGTTRAPVGVKALTYRRVKNDVRDGTDLAELTGHIGCVNAVCQVAVDGQVLLASAGYDRTVRLWEPTSRRQLLTIPLRDVPLALASDSPRMLFIGLDVGVLRIRLDEVSGR